MNFEVGCDAVGRWDQFCRSKVGETTMPKEFRPPDKQQPIDLTTDFLGEDRHEFIAKMAYQLWEQRGRPVGSPDTDWFAAEKAVYVSLAASGLVTPTANDPQHIAERIYT